MAVKKNLSIARSVMVFVAVAAALVIAAGALASGGEKKAARPVKDHASRGAKGDNPPRQGAKGDHRAGRGAGDTLDEMSLERWAKLREVERFQLKAAERYYHDQDWKAALAEYEKFSSLYEKSEAAPHAQLKWGLCQLKLRKANTAIKDGFQSVIDYWPDSPDAVLAAYHIGQAYKDMGQIAQAKKAFEGILKNHLRKPVAIQTIVDMIAITEIENDLPARVELWKKLVFDVEPTEETRKLRMKTARSLADYCFRQAEFDDAVKTLGSSCTAGELPRHVAEDVLGALADLSASAATRPKAEKLAGLAVEYVRRQIPASPSAADAQAGNPASSEIRRLLYAIADIHAAARQDARVPEVYDEVARRCGPSDEGLGRLAKWYEKKEALDEARKLYRRFKDQAAGLSRIAESYRKSRQYDAAVAAYREILPIDTAGRTHWLAEIASTHREAGQVKEAVGIYEQLLAADRTSAVSEKHWLPEIAATYREARRYRDAIAVYQKLLKADAEHTSHWLWNIATAHRDNGQFKEAIGYLRQCDNFPENYKLMADCHRKLGQYGEALILYNQLVASDAESAPWAMLQSGYTWEEAGKKEAAIKAFQQACKLYPKSKYASMAHNRLQDVYKISQTLGGANAE